MSRPYIPDHIDVKADKLAQRLKMSRQSVMIMILDSVLSEVDEEKFAQRFRETLFGTKDNKKRLKHESY